MYRWMDRWDGWVDQWMDRCIDGWMYRQLGGETDRQQVDNNQLARYIDEIDNR